MDAPFARQSMQTFRSPWTAGSSPVVTN